MALHQELFPSVPTIVAKVQAHIDRRRLAQAQYARHAVAPAARYP
ncbi:hypothetical protein ACFW2D_10690 [Streptomyces sp. NPDC058914]